MANDECGLGRENKQAIADLKENQERLEKGVGDLWRAINDLRNRSGIILGAALISAFGIIFSLIIKLVEMKNGS